MVNAAVRNTQWEGKERTSKHSLELFRFIMSLAHRTSDGLTSTWSVLDHLYNVPKQLLPNMRRIKEMTFKNVPELLKRNISLNNIKNSHSILSLNLLFCKRFCLSQLLIAARYLLLDRSVHQLDTPAFILVIWVIVLRSLHTEQICVIVWWIWDTAELWPHVTAW